MVTHQTDSDGDLDGSEHWQECKAENGKERDKLPRYKNQLKSSSSDPNKGDDVANSSVLPGAFVKEEESDSPKLSIAIPKEVKLSSSQGTSIQESEKLSIPNQESEKSLI